MSDLVCLPQSNLIAATGYKQKNDSIRRTVFYLGLLLTIVGGLLIYQRFTAYADSSSSENRPLSIEAAITVLVGFGMMAYACTNGKACCGCCSCC